MIDTQAIRSKILDLAMRGKLTEQLPEDGTAEELYRQIQAEKQSLIKAGKIKKEKPLPDISEEEIPFSIPPSWRWTYLGELFQHNTGKALNSSDTHGQQLEYITTSNLYWNRFELDGLKTMPFSDGELEKCTVRKGDLLVCEGGDIGRAAIWAYDYEMRIQNHIHRLRRYSENIYPEFYYYLLWLYKQTGRINGIGIGLQGFSSKRVHSLIVPLAPYCEAVRLVEVIKKAFSALDTIDALQAKYADNLAVLKSKLIDAAIQGKLTEQLPEDGNAEELYQQIQAEKQSLIKAGKIKKEKTLPEISAAEIPFEIPPNWKWVRFSDLYNLSNGVASRGTPGGKPRPVLRLADLISGKVNTNGIREIALSDDEFSSHKVLNGDLVFIRVNGSRDKVASAFLYSGETVISYCDHLFCGHRMSDSFDASYIMIVYHSTMAKAQIDPEIKTTAGQNTISQKSMGLILIPLPPLAEQRRIVERVSELLAVCDELKAVSRRMVP